MTKKKEKTLIGWREFISIPKLGVSEIKVKVDTGARTSALHVTNLCITKRGETYFADFVVHPKQDKARPQIKNRHRVSNFKTVKSSNGIATKRPVIYLPVIIGIVEKEIEITLVNRDLMGFRMLLGRTALKSEFIVDPEKSFVLKNKKRKIK